MSVQFVVEPVLLGCLCSFRRHVLPQPRLVPLLPPSQPRRRGCWLQLFRRGVCCSCLVGAGWCILRYVDLPSGCAGVVWAAGVVLIGGLRGSTGVCRFADGCV